MISGSFSVYVSVRDWCYESQRLNPGPFAASGIYAAACAELACKQKLGDAPREHNQELNQPVPLRKY
jgi:hypothetical protein